MNTYHTGQHVTVTDTFGRTITEATIKRTRTNPRNGSQRIQINHPIYGSRWFPASRVSLRVIERAVVDDSYVPPLPELF